MRTRSGRVYDLVEPNMDPNASSSGITSPTDYMTLEILKTLEEIKAQMNALGQRMDRLELERHDDSRNEERQLNNRREERINRNYNRYDEDDRYMKNIKVDVSNFDGRLDPQYYLDWVMSLERYFKWYEMSQERRVRFAAMKLVGQAGQYWSNVERLIALRRQEPIRIWDEMKAKLSQKYLPITFQDQLLDKWSRLT